MSGFVKMAEPSAKRAKATSSKTEIVVVESGAIPTSAPAGKLLTCYWNIRGLGQPIRMALEFVGAAFIDVRCEAGDPKGGSYKAHWVAQKPSLGLPFGGNLPFLIDGDTGTKLVQSNAILRFIGRKYNLLGDGSPGQTAQLDMLLDQLGEFDDSFTGMAYGSYNTGGKEAFIADRAPKILSGLAEALGDKLYLVCGTPTVVDFKAFELLLKFELAFGAGVPGTELSEYTERMRALPTMVAYFGSERYITHPINNHHAQFK